MGRQKIYRINVVHNNLELTQNEIMKRQNFTFIFDL